MAQFEWPSSLPQEQFFPVTQTRKDARVRTEMEAGPPKMRRRTTATVEPVTLTLRFEGDEKKIFDDFYKNTIEEGTLRFEWTNPTTRNTVDFRVGADGYPNFEIQRGGSSDGTLWVGEWSLEIMPTVQ
jgi:hypothetical protein